ncbi:hypothetical protein Lesp02_27460 [Lentzea sp. NBRC 105346]|uniref:hypothetical protein n=1 Tax=Lentzea sp. NBRC 105346 TaxID=3032205 RepID=UPI0025521170|nr:hypothetical protein [Lentzea sp. NBRC 105346]GLZ30557.1 hypothetical protein Lesp02_27460 [Lentzea sp. NBRC 105346]
MTDEPGKDLTPRVPPPPPIDPEQLRQFEEFQRFQEFQRYQQATGGGTPPPPPQQIPQKPKPLWQILLGSKLFRRLIYLAVVGIFALWAYNHYFVSEDPGGGIAHDSGGVTGGAQGLPSPVGLQGTVGRMYAYVADGDPKFGCGLFVTDQVKTKFAQAFGEKDCPATIAALKSKITDPTAYQVVGFPPSMMTPPASGKVTIDSCELDVRGGPRLGTFVVEKINQGWVIVDYTPSACG